MNKCKTRFNKTIKCAGEYIESEGCCLRHAVLFDIWIAEHDGYKVYGFKDSTIGDENPEQLKRWKRAQFHKWLDTLNEKQAERMMSV